MSRDGREWVALRGLVVKELRQVRADPRLLPLLVVAPILQLIIFGYAATLDVATARVVVVDQDGSPESRSVTSRLGASDSFELLGAVPDAPRAEALLDRGAGDLALVIPRGYGRALAGDGNTAVQLIVDGSDSTAASVGIGAAAGLVGSIARETAEARMARADEAAAIPAGVGVRSRVLYNPELKSRIFMVPGVLAMVLLIVTMIATSMAVVREKELGTLEQLVVTPVSRVTLLAAKLIPFALFGVLDTFIVLAVSAWLFRIPMRGSLLFLLSTVPLYIGCSLGLGLLASTISRTQQQAMMTSMFLVLMPMMYLSGFVFPIESMPLAVQPVTEIIPMRHFLTILRGVMLKGAGPAELWPAVTKLGVIGIGTFALAVSLFHKRID